MFIIRKIWYVITLPLLLITLITSPVASSTDSAELISENSFVFEKALLMGQGITTDGEYYYTSGAIAALDLTALAKFTFDDMEIVKSRINPLPKECSKRGDDHIGGISYYNGKLYAAVEDSDEYIYPCIVVFDCDTLKATGEVYNLPAEIYDDGVPWCAVDTETGYLYASKWTEAKTIYVYDINDAMKLVKEIPLTGLGVIDRIQGGEFYNGTLYLSNDVENNGNIKNVLSVDVNSGEVKIFAQRDVGGENIEAEGMTFGVNKDGAVLHVLDYNKVIGIFVRHYNVDFGENLNEV
ncbi:MAG: hypothetical protein IKJ41_05420 [Clostridia bacterium]|nr:hypothetical protein [Clostridia bacterium]